MTIPILHEDFELVEQPVLLLVPSGTSGDLLEGNLLDAGYVVTTAEDEQEALRLMFSVKPDYVIHGSDIMARPGTELLELRTIVRKSSRPPLPA